MFATFLADVSLDEPHLDTLVRFLRQQPGVPLPSSSSSPLPPPSNLKVTAVEEEPCGDGTVGGAKEGMATTPAAAAATASAVDVKTPAVQVEETATPRKETGGEMQACTVKVGGASDGEDASIYAPTPRQHSHIEYASQTSSTCNVM